MICFYCYWFKHGKCILPYGALKYSDTFCGSFETEEQATRVLRSVMNGDYIIKDIEDYGNQD